MVRLLVDAHELPLRTVERVMTYIALSCAAAGNNPFFLSPLVAGLCVMRHTHPPLYDKARRGELTWEEAATVIQPVGGRGVQEGWPLNVWKFTTVGGVLAEDDTDRMANIMVPHHAGPPTDIIPIMTKYIDSFINI